MNDRLRVEAWSINIRWSDGNEEHITEVPYYVARTIDQFLDEIENEKEKENDN
jgi:hypothetical protein